MWLALTFAALIGLSLGVLGAGGAIVTVPLLVYAANVPPGEAVKLSLAVVGATSLVGMLFKARERMIHWHAAAWFGGAGTLGALVGAQFTPLVPPQLLLLLFAVLMIAVASVMLRRKEASLQPLPECHPWRCGLAGMGVGGLTGFLGVGGGFLLVPAMVLFARLPLKVATATSLVVIAINSFAGLVGHWHHGNLDWGLTGKILAAALLGLVSGLPLAARVPAARLGRAFAWFVLAVAVFVLAKIGVVGI